MLAKKSCRNFKMIMLEVLQNSFPTLLEDLQINNKYYFYSLLLYQETSCNYFAQYCLFHNKLILCKAVDDCSLLKISI